MKTRTSSPTRCTWMRAPSSLYSTDASPDGLDRLAAARPPSPRASAAPARPTTSPTASSSSAVPVSARRAVSPRSPESIAARRTRRRRAVGCPGDRVEQHALERAGAQVAEEHAADEVLLALGRPRRELAQRRRARSPARPRARRHGEPVERVVEVGDREARRRRPARPSRPPGRASRRRPAPAAGLPTRNPTAGAISSGSSRREQVGERVDLRQPRAGRGDGVGGGDELVEQHGASLSATSDIRAKSGRPLACRVAYPP